MRKQTGVIAEELRTLKPLPAETKYIWSWFEDLSAARGAGFSIEPISWGDMRAYFDLIRLQPARWEVSALRRLDDAFLTSRITKAVATAGTAKSLGARITGKASKRS